MRLTFIAVLVLFPSLAAGCGDDSGGDPDAGVMGMRDGSVVGIDGAPVNDGATATDGGGGTRDGGPAAGSDGCGRALEIATGEWVAHTLDVGGVSRSYFVYLPDGYDADRAYPVVYQWHGCNSAENRESNNVPVQRESGAEAIHVRGRAVDACWDSAPTGPDVAFFDALVPAVEGTWCADESRRFVTGYSSGSFMAHRLACVRGDMIRGVATIAGGQGGRDCAADVGALLIHDTDDSTVNISASESARDAYVAANGCDASAALTPTDDPPCAAYAGCDPSHPVVWCQTSGNDHARQDDLAAPAFWHFLSSL